MFRPPIGIPLTGTVKPISSLVLASRVEQAIEILQRAVPNSLRSRSEMARLPGQL
jgi:hypothetical protein